MSEQWMTLLAVASIWMVAVVTPGPNFFVVLRAALVWSPRHALLVASGIWLGTVVWGLAGYFGIAVLFTLVPVLYLAVKVVGGCYLLYIGVRAIYGSFSVAARTSVAVADAIRPAAAVKLGLITTLTNPKAAIFVPSMFASTMPAQPSWGLGVASVALMVLISMLWYSTVAWLCARPRVLGLYQRGRHWAERVAGAVFASFGLQLLAGR